MQNKMKKIFIFTLLFPMLISSCDKSFLEEHPKSFMVDENLYINTAGFETALNSLYYHLREDRNGEDAFPAMYTGTDIAYSVFSHANVKPFESYGAMITPSIYDVSFWWDRNYVGISWANKIIQEAQNSGVKWNDPSDKNRIIAEAKFFRAYYHNFLTNLYGDVPIADQFFSTPKFDFVRAHQQEVLEFERNDLKYAVANLPTDESKTGKLTKWAAMHLLTEVYLHLNKPDSAEIIALTIINSGHFHLMTSRFGVNATKPGDVYSDLFLEGNTNRSEGNMESIWVIQQAYGVTGGKTPGEYAGDWSRRVFLGYYQSVPGLLITDSLGGRGVGRIRPLTSWVKSYESNDIRASKYNLRRHYYYNNAASLPTGFHLGDLVPYTSALDSQRNIYPTIRKWDFGVQGRGGAAVYLSMDKCRAEYRLSDTYLFLAEARLKQNNLPGAADALNAVRSRAGASLVTVGQVSMDFILDERARELFGEEYRLLTLHRTGTFLARVRRLNWQVSAAVQDKHALWPIPQTAIDSNTGATLEQNTGY
jgi:starch-binding outer membrane protein, SusD/RagB family